MTWRIIFARARAYTKFDGRMKADAALDPNWTFSDIMQRLLEEYRRMQLAETDEAKAGDE
ncbi:MAG: hypothetical protein M3X11_15510 [Acidobacteriota bacterium]|nr:hypothetical protein [Acidobacteriota bacterium]